MRFDNALRESSFASQRGGFSSDDDEQSTTTRGAESDVSEIDPWTEAHATAKAETRKMRISKTFVILSILLSGAGISTGVYIMQSNQEEKDYESEFYVHATSVADVWKNEFKGLHDTLSELGQEIVASSKTSKSSFPFATMPLFEVNARNARKRSGLEVISFLPLIKEKDKEEWNRYSIEHQDWLKEGRDLYQEEISTDTEYDDSPILPFIYSEGANGVPVPATAARGLYAPAWQSSPPPIKPYFVNYNFLGTPELQNQVFATIEKRDVTFSMVYDMSRVSGTSFTVATHDEIHRQYVRMDNGTSAFAHPHALVLAPIYGNLSHPEESAVVGLMLGILPFDRYFSNLFHEDVRGIDVILTNNCGQSYTYAVDGRNAAFVGEGQRHDEDHTIKHLEVEVPFCEDGADDDSSDGDHDHNYDHDHHSEESDGESEVTALPYCDYYFHIMPSGKFEEDAATDWPLFLALCTAAVFVVIVCAFLMYDFFNRKRNRKIVDSAAKANAIVSSLFPSHIRDQLLEKEKPKPERNKSSYGLKGYLHENGENTTLTESTSSGSKPIAELFPDTTVMFANIVGFTAWSSVREPAQVFILLESVYDAFDQIAHRRRVFKVETIGDSYVAVTGLPDPRPDHAVVMARFARDCRDRMIQVVTSKEVDLGPDTSELTIRIGLHTGPVTAGVLRGDRARFQLFGDTVNLASTMEHSGRPNWIQVSSTTAEQLIAQGKESWLQKRADQIVAKGKGTIQTYWLAHKPSTGSIVSGKKEGSQQSNYATEVGEASPASTSLMSNKMSNLVQWNVEVLAKSLKQIIASRTENVRAAMANSKAPMLMPVTKPMEEVVEIVTLPKHPKQFLQNPDDITLDETVMSQLRQYVGHVAALYRQNPFHNFEHASHVTMSVVKLLSRIIAPTENELTAEELAEDRDRHLLLHDHTYGITSDPLTQFACVFSALIHDVDHTGVPNTQLVNEGSHLAHYYQDKSVAEQNSVDLAWDLFMGDDFAELRKAICVDQAELKRFRQLVVNSVMATDIMDKELKALRNRRWDVAFNETRSEDFDETVDRNRKATIVIEHLIQASDVAHTMQHWHVYRKWNEKLYREMAKAFAEGRSGKHPSEFWYEGEIGFFDFYIIPLARKLKNCGVFGVSSDEYLNYAMQNRQEWQIKGKAVVAEVQAKLESGEPFC